MKQSTPSVLNPRELTLLALFAALMVTLQVVMSFIPNVHPVALLVILLTVHLGWKALFSVAAFVILEGLIYGFGHAVYTLSDPRAEILRKLCRNLAEEQGCMYKFTFYKLFEDTVREVSMERMGHTIPSNVDLYSGLAYSMLGIPEELFTPLFATARVAGWVAHNLENKLYDGKIMRPATKYVGETQEFIPMEDRF